MTIFLAVVAVGIAVGFGRRGSLRNLASAPLRGVPLIFLAVLLQALAWKVVPARLDDLAYILVVVSYAAVFAFTLANRRAPWIAVIAVGALMNFTVILLNQGMPTSVRAAEHLGLSVDETRALLVRGKHVLETDSTRLRFLGDVIPIPGGRSLASPGDLVLWTGLALTLQSLMVSGRDVRARRGLEGRTNRSSLLPSDLDPADRTEVPR